MEELLNKINKIVPKELIVLDLIEDKSKIKIVVDSAKSVDLNTTTYLAKRIRKSELLDVLYPDGYQLEVSSPGLDRPLVTPAHYQRFLGEQVRVQLVAPRDNRRKWLGVLLSADDDGIELMAAEGRVTLSYSEIERARLVPDFDRELAKS